MSSKRSVLFLCAGVVLVVGGFMGANVLAESGGVDVRGEPDLEVYTPDNTYAPGEVAELSIQVDNDGELRSGSESQRELVTTARNVVVEADSDDTPIEVRTDKRAIGSVTEDQPGEAPIEIEVPDSVEPGTYEIDVRIEYTWTERARDRSQDQTEIRNERSRGVTQTVEIEVDDDARFRVEDVDSTLRVDEEGEISGNITNIGGEDITNAELTFNPTSENIFALETDVAVGDIDAGDSAEFSIPVEAGSEARAVNKRFELPVTYRDSNGIRAEDSDPDFITTIGEKRDEFIVEPADRTISAGSSTEFDVEVTNNREERLTDIEPKLFTNDPLDSDDDEGFIESLEPGESTTVTFELNAESGATAKTYPVQVDFRYDDSRQRSQLSDTYRMAIDVTESQDDGLPLGIIAIGLVVLAGGGYALYRRD